MPLDGHFGIVAYSHWVRARFYNLTVEGIRNVPLRGPALIVARHYHHLYDGSALLTSNRRPVRVFVALDWVRDARQRAMMERLCRFARWPIALRSDGFRDGEPGGFEPRELLAYVRSSLATSVELMRAGELLAIFPEGYPTIDPVTTRKGGEEWLPFAPGFLKIVEMAAREGISVPLIPAGFSYRFPAGRRAEVTLRYGAPIVPGERFVRRDLLARVENEVHRLSAG